MAKYCAQCGSRLPDGVEICPDCNVEGQETDAALFTMMTAETEVWKESEQEKTPKPKRVRKLRSAAETKKLTIISCAAAAVILIAIIIFLATPAQRIGRALRAGEFDRAAEIYWSQSESRLATRSSAIDKKLVKTAEKVCDSFSKHELDEDTAADYLAKLGGFGEGAGPLLEPQYVRFRALCASRNHMLAAEDLSLRGEFLAAREEYLQVIEDDMDFAAAQEKAEACIGQYADSVLSAASVFVQTGDYAAAVLALKECNHTLFTYNTFNQDVDAKLAGCIGLFEEDTLTDARKLAELDDYAAAAELVRNVIETYDMDTEALCGALEEYEAAARSSVLENAMEQAKELFEREEYEAAFAQMDALTEEVEPGEDLDAAIAEFEEYFSTQVIEKALAIFDMKRENLPEAVKLLENVLKVRELERVDEYLAEISQYLPLKLAEADLQDKNGIILRTSKTFEGMDGTKYENWIWGDNKASMTIALDGNYDVFQAAFAMRTDDNKNANGHFEITCDGKMIYKSDKLYHWQKDPIAINVDVSGCQEMKISFFSDYNVNSAAGGYCYHGLCEAVVLKDMP